MVLIGVLIIILGFSFKLDSLAVVVVAGVITGLVGGIDLKEVLSILGGSFVHVRYVSLFLLILPVVAICERYGLKAQAILLVSRIKNLSSAKLLSLYCFLRQITLSCGLSIGGHPQFVRPLVQPMSEGAFLLQREKDLEKAALKHEIILDDKEADLLKAAAAANDNYGNFFGQNLFVGAPGVLLVASTFTQAGVSFTNSSLVSLYSIPVAVLAFLLACGQNYLTDKALHKNTQMIIKGLKNEQS